MKTIRSFVAIPLAPEVQRGAVRLIERLRQTEDGIKWVPTDNLHLTLKFLGDVDNTEVPSVCDVMRDVVGEFDPFDLTFIGAGGFPDIERPRVLFAGVEDPSQSLTQMVNGLEREFAELGFKREPRDYTPHLTLGRTRGSGRRAGTDVIDRLKKEESTALGSMPVESVQLIASFLDKQGPTYQVMDTVVL